MSELRVSIEVGLGNDDGGEMEERLRLLLLSFGVVSRSVSEPLRAGEAGTILDANGNSVGRWRVDA